MDTSNRRKRILPILTCGWTGYVKPTLALLGKELDILEPVIAPLPAWLDKWYLLKTIRWPKAAWRREWKRWAEEMPPAFEARTSRCIQILDNYNKDYDLILLSGTLYGLGKFTIQKPVIVMTDSTRRLSASNTDDAQHRFTTKAQAQSWYALEQKVFEDSAAVVVGSQFVKSSLVEDYGIDEDKIHPIGFLAGEGHSEEVVTKKFDGRTILFVGKGDFEKKGGRLLLDAFRKIRQRLPEARLIIAGQQQAFDEPGVESVGFIRDRNRMRELFEQAHVFALPSFVDRFGMTLLEAMSAGTPVIAANYAAMPEIVGDTGRLVEKGDAEQLADYLLEILTDENLASELGARARRRYEEVYADNVIGGKLLSVINHILIQKESC